MSSAAPQDIGTASGAFSTMRQLGGAFVAILVAVFSRTGSYASAQAFSNGFSSAIGGCAALSLTGAIASLAAPSRRTATKIATPLPVEAATGAQPAPATSTARPGS